MNKIPFIEEYLDNGIRVIMSQNKRIPISIIYVVFKVGSKMEPKGKKGIAHLLEHLMFSDKYDGGRTNFDELLSINGGDSNASTSYDYTSYYIQVPSVRLDFAVSLDSERFNNISFDENSINIQKMIVKEEKFQSYDNVPYGEVDFLSSANLFKNTDYEIPIIGLENDIEGITSGDIKKFYEEYYNANNCVISVTGNINYTRTCKILNKYYGTLPVERNKPYIFKDNNFNSPVMLYPKSKVKIELNSKFIFFKIPGIGTKDSYILKFISIILGDGFSSRLYRNLVYEKKIAVSAFSVASSYQHTGSFEFAILFDNKKNDKKIESIIFNEIESLSRGDFTDEEFEKAKNKIQLLFATALQKNAAIAQRLLFYGIFHNNVNLINEDIKNYLSITKEDIKNAVKKYLDINKRLVITYLK